MHVSMFVCVYMCATHTNVSIYIWLFYKCDLYNHALYVIYLHMYIYMYACMCVCLSVCIYICVMRECMSAYVNVCACTRARG